MQQIAITAWEEVRGAALVPTHPNPWRCPIQLGVVWLVPGCLRVRQRPGHSGWVDSSEEAPGAGVGGSENAPGSVVEASAGCLLVGQQDDQAGLELCVAENGASRAPPRLGLPPCPCREEGGCPEALRNLGGSSLPPEGSLAWRLRSAVLGLPWLRIPFAQHFPLHQLQGGPGSLRPEAGTCCFSAPTERPRNSPVNGPPVVITGKALLAWPSGWLACLCLSSEQAGGGGWNGCVLGEEWKG